MNSQNRSGLLSALLVLCACATTKSAVVLPRADAGRAQPRLVSLALLQAENVSPTWEPAQRDCAGFVRFLYREAVTSESTMWRDHSGHLVPYVTGAEMIAYNFERLRPGEEPKTGDILVYHRPDQKPADAWHMMMVLRSPHEFQQRALVIYHNGESGDKGAIRKLWLEDIEKSPFSEWRMNAANPNFMGVYRWKGWS